METPKVPKDSAERNARPKQGGHGIIGVVVSVALHAVILAAVLLGWQASEAPKQKRVVTKVVQAKLVQLKAKSKPVKAAKPKPKQKIIDLTKKKKAAEQRKRNEKKKALQRAKLKKEKDRKAKAAKDKAAKAKKAKEKAALEKLNKEKAAKEAKRLRELEFQSQLDSEMKAERKALQAQQQAEEDEQYAQSFSAIIRQRIQNNWSRPASARKGMTCDLQIQLVPTGRVINVTVIKSSGNASFDRSAVQAVKRSEQFPELKQLPPAVFERNFRQFTLSFDPKDLRL